jgi:Transposase
MAADKKLKRRKYSAELKAQVVNECEAPGASVARAAMARGINANIVHSWCQIARTRWPTSATLTHTPTQFVLWCDQPLTAEPPPTHYKTSQLALGGAWHRAPGTDRTIKEGDELSQLVRCKRLQWSKYMTSAAWLKNEPPTVVCMNTVASGITSASDWLQSVRIRARMSAASESRHSGTAGLADRSALKPAIHAQLCGCSTPRPKHTSPMTASVTHDLALSTRR